MRGSLWQEMDITGFDKTHRRAEWIGRAQETSSYRNWPLKGCRRRPTLPHVQEGSVLARQGICSCKYELV